MTDRLTSVHLVRRHFVFVDGSKSVQLMMAYDDKETAKKELQTAVLDTNGLLGCQLVESAGAGKVHPVGMNLGQAMKLLGIKGIACDIAEIEVRGVISTNRPGLVTLS